MPPAPPRVRFPVEHLLPYVNYTPADCQLVSQLVSVVWCTPTLVGTLPKRFFGAGALLQTVGVVQQSHGICGMVVTERLEPDSFSGDPGLPADWVVVGERLLDSNGTHSWALLSNDISLDAHWLPIELYRFEDSSFSMNFGAGAPAGATPEASTWAMMLIGFACLAVAGYRNTKKHQLLRSSCYMSGGSSDT